MIKTSKIIYKLIINSRLQWLAEESTKLNLLKATANLHPHPLPNNMQAVNIHVNDFKVHTARVTHIMSSTPLTALEKLQYYIWLLWLYKLNSIGNIYNLVPIHIYII